MKKTLEYWTKFARKNKLTPDLPDAWMFGDGSEEMADELGGLVVSGLKTGTCAALDVYEYEGEKYPIVGQYNIVLDGREAPLAIIQYTKIELVPMNKVSVEFARTEGEGDLSYEYWYKGHERFFTQELKTFGQEFKPDILLVCQNFKLIDIYEKNV